MKDTSSHKIQSDKVANYLTQIKELPQEEKPKERAPGFPRKTHTEVKVEEPDVRPKHAALPQKRHELKLVKPSSETKASKTSEEFEEEEEEGREKKRRSSFQLPPRDTILAVVNLVTTVIMIFLLMKLPKLAAETKRLRNESAQGKENISLSIGDIKEESARVEKLKTRFLNESGVVDFVKEVEELKKGGTVTKLSFPSPKAVKDKTGNFGIPVIIDLKGGWENLGVDFVKLQNLAFLFRAVNIEIAPPLEEEGLEEVKYGGFLYVEDKLGQN